MNFFFMSGVRLAIYSFYCGVGRMRGVGRGLGVGSHLPVHGVGLGVGEGVVDGVGVAGVVGTDWLEKLGCGEVLRAGRWVWCAGALVVGPVVLAVAGCLFAATSAMTAAAATAPTAPVVIIRAAGRRERGRREAAVGIGAVPAWRSRGLVGLASGNQAAGPVRSADPAVQARSTATDLSRSAVARSATSRALAGRPDGSLASICPTRAATGAGTSSGSGGGGLWTCASANAIGVSAVNGGRPARHS